MQQSSHIGDALLRSPWYLCGGPFRRITSIILANCTQPLVMTGGKFFILGFNKLSSVSVCIVVSMSFLKMYAIYQCSNKILDSNRRLWKHHSLTSHCYNIWENRSSNELPSDLSLCVYLCVRIAVDHYNPHLSHIFTIEHCQLHNEFITRDFLLDYYAIYLFNLSRKKTETHISFQSNDARKSSCICVEMF